VIGELVAAFMLLTRLPVGRLGCVRADSGFADAVWAYPIVGVAVGVIGAASYWLSVRIGLPPAFAAICGIAATALATGGIHEDAVADMADGFGGGRSRAQKLEIMRDSRVGSFGVLALVLSVAARAAAITSIAAPGKVAIALIGSGVLARGAMLVPIILLAPARTDGLGAGLRTTGMVRALVGLILSATIALLLLPSAVAPGAVATTVLAAVCLSALAWRQIGGYTGDVLGATEVIAECVTLGLLAAGWITDMSR
jgi:adenosylcobinamide-GDP ribazoletransferase